MADPEADSGFVFDDQERTDILNSPFFDFHLEYDDSVEEYVKRVIFTLSYSIEEHITAGSWILVSHPAPPPAPANFPVDRIRRALLLMVATSVALAFFFH